MHNSMLLSKKHPDFVIIDIYNQRLAILKKGNQTQSQKRVYQCTKLPKVKLKLWVWNVSSAVLAGKISKINNAAVIFGQKG